MYFALHPSRWHFANRAKANCFRGLCAGNAALPTAASPAGPCPPTAAGRCLPPAGKGGRGPPRTPRVCWAALSCPPPPGPFTLPSPGVAGEVALGTRSSAPGLAEWFSSRLLKDKARSGKALRSSGVARRCPWTRFTIVISDGGGERGTIYL